MTRKVWYSPSPHIVKEKLSDALYKIALDTDEEIVVNAERLKKYYHREACSSPGGPITESDSEDEPDEAEDEDAPEERQQLEVPEDDLHAHADLQQQEDEIRGQRQGPIMRNGGKFWSNVDASNILRSPRLRK